jgi:hypothetical protein
VRLERLLVLGQERLADPREEALVGGVDALHLDLDRVPVQEVVPLLLGVVADRLERVEEARLGERLHHPAVGLPAGDRDRAVRERLGVVEELGGIDVRDGAHALAAQAHAADDAEALLDLLAVHHEDTRGVGRGDVEGERLLRPDVRLGEPAEEEAQQCARVGGGADRGAETAAHRLLVDEDRGGQPV